MNATEEKEFSILIIEDNDDLRNHINSFLKSIYTTFLAENGKQGLEIAKAEVPDLILTDVSMPEVDGIEFCTRLKAMQETSHIPVVMITARALEKDQIKGYESGATDYIIKPFVASILQLKIRNILDSVKKLREKFSIEKNNFEEYTSNDKDAELMKKVMNFISLNYQKSELTIDSLTSELGMSRSSLYRKLHSITGKSPLDLLQMFRLQKAHDLLLHSSLNISEIAYTVGYTDPGYFSTRFKEFYNVAPSALVKGPN
ncbi:MAG: response regulator [Flavobacteriales bacterium]